MIVSLQILEQLFRVASTLKNIPDDEAVLTAKLDRFERRQAIRATLQVLTFFVLMGALIAALDEPPRVFHDRFLSRSERTGGRDTGEWVPV